MRARRYLLVAACGSLLACNFILGVGDLEGPTKKAGQDGGIDWGGFSDSSYTPPDTGTTDTTPVATSKRVFVTSAQFAPNFGGVEGGNAACRAAAASAGLSGTWVAWLSGGTTLAIDLLKFVGPYTTVSGATVVANKGTLLDGGLGAPIDEVEDGGKAPRDTINGVWTGTRYGGAVGETCINAGKPWADRGVITFGTAGSFDKTDRNWTDNGGQPGISRSGWSCSFAARLYCFEQ